ncbi:hypothetical protein EYW49_09630 [Siculibacillus lacustris]|uniref:Uncharacterized protein n=1 Tax=Siculibacillus lacustris TaxID=1549641 RepID=A0A4Q9VSZ8_9HYPH|nr:hypothetical protein [Siculibacillus lacustris]TBW38201.1 hypothetical protein EYW49_09630 [Siculibacillus lacustris]
MTYDIRRHPDSGPDLRDWTDPCLEPSLSEILADPMMELVFRRDSLHRDNVEHFLRGHASRLAARPTPCRCASPAA